MTPASWNLLLDRALPFHALLDERLTITRVGPLLARLAPSVKPGLALQDCFEVVCPRHLKISVASIGESSRQCITLASQEGWKFQGEFIMAEGETFWVCSPVVSDLRELTAGGITLADLPGSDLMGDFLVMLGISGRQMRDLHEQAETLRSRTRELELATDELARAMEIQAVAAREQEARAAQREQFFAFLNHETRTPAQAIVGLLGLLQEKRLTGEPGRLIETAARSAHHLRMMLEQVIDLGREDRPLEARSEPFSPEDLLEEARQLLAVALAGKGVRHSCNADGPLPSRLLADATRIRQVLFNLANNAAKYTDSGEVSIVAGYEPGEESGGVIRFRVSDTGIGIPKAERDRIFQDGYRASNTAARPGFGYGLSLSDRLVRHLGGSVSFESRNGPGTTVVFRVPVSHDGAGTTAVPPLSAADGGAPIWPGAPRRPRVLLVEDYAPSQQFATLALTASHVLTDTAGSAKAALAAAEMKRYDLIIMDLTLPDGNGCDVAAAIRQHQAGIAEHATPIVALTAMNRATVEEECMAAGIEGLYTKPLNAAEVRQIVRRHARHTPHVVIAERNPAAAEALRIYISGHKVTSTHVATRSALIRALERRPCEVLLLGQMPGVTTRQAVRSITRLAGSAISWVTSPELASEGTPPLRSGVDVFSRVASPMRPTGPHHNGGGIFSEPDISDLIEAYVAELRPSLEQCERALQSRNFELIKRTAHNLKGTAHTFGFPTLTAPARALESAAKAASASAVAEALADLFRNLDGVSAPPASHENVRHDTH